MKSEQIERALLETVEKVVRNEMIDVLYGWPPKCPTLLYQPKRPKPVENSQDFINKAF